MATKIVDGVEVELTAQDIADIAASEAAAAGQAGRNSILAQIAGIEVTITPRRIREAMLTDAGKAWIASADAQITALRVQL